MAKKTPAFKSGYSEQARPHKHNVAITFHVSGQYLKDVTTVVVKDINYDSVTWSAGVIDAGSHTAFGFKFTAKATWDVAHHKKAPRNPDTLVSNPRRDSSDLQCTTLDSTSMTVTPGQPPALPDENYDDS